MKDLKELLTEKLNLTKDSNFKNRPEFYFTCDIEDISDNITSKDIDKKLKTFSPDPWFGPMERKNSRGNTNNKFWYAIYCYLINNGPDKRENIVKYLKPGGNTQYAGLFAQMGKKNMFSHGEKEKRGLLYPNPPKEWIDKS